MILKAGKSFALLWFFLSFRFHRLGSEPADEDAGRGEQPGENGAGPEDVEQDDGGLVSQLAVLDGEDGVCVEGE